jgi:excisionase family DNA binding protein
MPVVVEPKPNPAVENLIVKAAPGGRAVWWNRVAQVRRKLGTPRAKKIRSLGGAASPVSLTIRELVEWLRVRPTMLYRAASAGTIPAMKMGGRWRFSQDVVERWLLDRMAGLTGRAEPGNWLFDSQPGRGSRVNRRKKS